MALLLFALTFGAERRPLLRRGRFSVGVVALTYLLFAVVLKTPLERGILGILAVGTLDSLLLGFSVALQPDVLWYAFLGCLVGTLVGMLPGIGPLAGISILLPATFGLDTTKSDRDARRHLLRLAVRRLDHLDPDADSGRGRLGDDLHRRLRHGAEGPRGRGAVHRRRRLVHRRHVRRDHADADRAAARHFRAALRTARIHRAAGARPGLPRLHVVDLAAAHPADGVRSGCCSAPSASTT